MASGDRQSRGGGRIAASGDQRPSGPEGPEEGSETARKTWIFILVAVLLAGTLLAWALEPAPKINNKTVIEKTQTRIVPTIIPGPTVRQSNNKTVIEVKPGPTVTKTASPRPSPKPTPRPSPHPSPTPTCQVIRIGGICVGAR